MIYYAADLVSDSNLQELMLAFFTAIFGAISVGIVQIYQLKSKAKETGNAVQEAKQEASAARENTTNIANGFASGVGSKLDRLIASQDRMENRLASHLEWHLNKETQK